MLSQSLPSRLRALWWRRGVQTEVYGLIKDWSLEEHSYLRESVPKTGLQTPFRNGTLQDVALKVRSEWHALLSQPPPEQQA